MLGVAKSASPQEIKKAYRKLASELHPDKNPGAASEKRFKKVTGAYEVLGDSSKRAIYDEFGDVSLRAGFDVERARAARDLGGFGGLGGQRGQQGAPFDVNDMFGGGGGGGGFGDMLGDMFRRSHGAGPAGGMRAQRGHDTTSDIKISFVDAVRGTTLKLTPRGGGEHTSVRIPAGASDGSKVRVRGKGGPGQHGGSSGDMLLVLEVESHPHFERDGDNLRLDLPITLHEAYAGAQVVVPTPGGDVKLKVPKRVQSGQKLRLRGKGVQRKGKPAGDLYVRFMVVYPDSDDVADMIEKLSAEQSDPREGIGF
jgi:curved DNA-binding protein